MASSGGHLLVSKTLRLIRFGVDKARNAVRERLGQLGQAESRTERIYARLPEQPVNRINAIKQSQSRQFSTNRIIKSDARQFSTTAKRTQRLRSSYPNSQTRTAVSNSTGRTPFASTLRPNLTGGTLSRTAGGYSTGVGRVGGVRYFSHGPTHTAEVVQNVSQAVRAFWLQGKRARFDGYDAKTGRKRYRALSPAQEKARDTFDLFHAHSAGSFVDFKVSPTITAVGPLSTVPRAADFESQCFASEAAAPVMSTIADDSVMSTLAIDFARALKDLAAVLSDIKRLATLGSLPLILINPTTLRVRFPGCDRDTVETLCNELGVSRGIVGEDHDFDLQHGAEMALRFPLAPSKTASEADLEGIHDGWRSAKRTKRENVDWHGMVSVAESLESVDKDLIHDGEAFGFMSSNGDIVAENPWQESCPSILMSDYSSLHASEHTTDAQGFTSFQPNHGQYSIKRNREPTHTEYEGIEGIYKFIEHCDKARR